MDPVRIPLHQRLTVQLSAAFAGVFVLFATALGYSLYLAEQRERDLVVVDTAARLQVLAFGMQRQAQNYLRVPARNYASYFRDVQLYYRELQSQRAAFDQALGCFVTGRFEQHAHRTAAKRVYTFEAGDHPSVQAALRTWRDFTAGLDAALGGDSDEPRLEYAAEYVQRNAPHVERTASTLYAEFEQAALARLESSRQLNRVVVGAAVVLFAFIVWWTVRALRPLRAAVSGFQRVAQGDFGFRVRIDARNELGMLTRAFNSMTERLCAMLRLIDRLHQGGDPAAALRIVSEELARVIPLDWVGLLKVGDEQAILSQEHACVPDDCLGVRRYRRDSEPIAQAVADARPLRIPDLSWTGEARSGTDLSCDLRRLGFSAVMLIPIQDDCGEALLALATKRPYGYLLEHQELIANLTPFIAHALARQVRTYGTPNPGRMAAGRS